MASKIKYACISCAVPNKYAEQTLKKPEITAKKDKINKIKLSKDASKRQKSVLLGEVLLLAN